MALHRILEPDIALTEGHAVAIVGDEAQHAARVKRLEEDDRLEILDGRGTVGLLRITRIAREGKRGEWTLAGLVERIEQAPRDRTLVEVWSAAPKGPRLEEMIDGLSQAGCALWRPLISERTVVEPREGKLSRLERTARESAKQCGRAWLMEIGEPIDLRRALEAASDTDARSLVADAAGRWPGELSFGPPPPARIRLLVGPEGGFAERELRAIDEAGIARLRLGPHIMRIETAAVIGAAALVAHLAQASNAAESG